jgi:hypothetical protein
MEKETSWLLLLIQYYSGDEIYEAGLGDACNTCGREENCKQNIS